MKKGTNPKANPFNSNGKDNKFSSQLKAVQTYLLINVSTSAMTAGALGIRVPNVCRHKRSLQLSGLLVVVRKGYCKETGYRAEYLSTNPELIKQSKKGIYNGI